MGNRYLMCMLQSAFRGGYAVHIHRPTQGWTVREYILLCKVSLLHPPSSLGLDGDGTFLPRHENKGTRETAQGCGEDGMKM